MVVDSILPHAKNGPNDHRKDGPRFIIWSISYDQYHIIWFIWYISHCPNHMAHIPSSISFDNILWSISYGLNDISYYIIFSINYGPWYMPQSISYGLYRIFHIKWFILYYNNIIIGWKPNSPHTLNVHMYYRFHIRFSIFYDPYHMVYIKWTIQYKPYNMLHILWIISYDIGVKPFHPFFDVDQNVRKQVMSNAVVWEFSFHQKMDQSFDTHTLKCLNQKKVNWSTLIHLPKKLFIFKHCQLSILL